MMFGVSDCCVFYLVSVLSVYVILYEETHVLAFFFDSVFVVFLVRTVFVYVLFSFPRPAPLTPQGALCASSGQAYGSATRSATDLWERNKGQAPSDMVGRGLRHRQRGFQRCVCAFS